MTDTTPSPHELISHTIKLATLPEVYFEIRRLMDDPESSLYDLGRVVMRDPALTARLLRIANSAFFGFARKIETVSHAVSILGFQQIHDLVLATSVANAFNGISPEAMDMAHYWHNSVYCGVVARLLATHCNVLDSERLFVEGLLRDIGHLILYDRLPRLAHEARRRATEDGLQLFREERALMGFDYAQLGAMLAREWQLPTSLGEAIHHHTEPARAEDYLLETSLVHIAALATESLDGLLGEGPWTPLVAPVAWQVTGLVEEDLPGVLEEAEQRTEEAVELFFPGARRAAG